MATETNSPGNSILLQALTKRFDTLSQLSSWRGNLSDAHVDGFAFPYKYIADSVVVADGVYSLNSKGGNGSQPGRWISQAPHVNIREYGATGLGIASDSGAIQKAVDYASTFNGPYLSRTVFFPNGTYRLTAGINVTNTRVNDTFMRDGIRLQGESMTGTVFVGETGSTAMFDLTGAQFAEVCDLRMYGSQTTNPSTVGIYTGIFAALTQTQNQLYRNIIIQLADLPSANSGIGTVAFWNFGAEENTHDHVYYEANRALLLTAYRDTPATYANPRGTQLDAHSLGVTTMTGECFLKARGNHAPALETNNVNSLHTDNIYINGEASGTQKAGIVVRNGLYNSRLRGTIEGFPAVIQIHGEVHGGEINFHTGNVFDQDTASVLLTHGQGWINNTDININSNEPTTRPMFGLVGHPGGQVESTSYMAGLRLRTNYPLTSVIPPFLVLHNPYTRDVSLSSASAPAYMLHTAGHHSLAFPRRKILENTVINTNIFKVVLPPYVATLNGKSILLNISGMVSMDAPESSSTTVRPFTTALTIITPFDANTASFVVDTTLGTQMSNRPLGNSVDGLTFSATLVNNEIVINVAPVVSGSNADAVYLIGEARLYAGGDKYRSPYLLPM